MAIVYETSLKTTRLADVVAAIDSGGAGSLLIYESDGTTLIATLPLSATCGTVSGDVLTFNTITPGISGVSGTAAKASVKNGSGTVVVSGLTVGLSGSDINLSAIVITSGDTVTVSSAAITHG